MITRGGSALIFDNTYIVPQGFGASSEWVKKLMGSKIGKLIGANAVIVEEGASSDTIVPIVVTRKEGEVTYKVKVCILSKRKYLQWVHMEKEQAALNTFVIPKKCPSDYADPCYTCPTCGVDIGCNAEEEKYCHNCRQAFAWPHTIHT